MPPLPCTPNHTTPWNTSVEWRSVSARPFRLSVQWHDTTTPHTSAGRNISPAHKVSRSIQTMRAVNSNKQIWKKTEGKWKIRKLNETYYQVFITQNYYSVHQEIKARGYIISHLFTLGATCLGLKANSHIACHAHAVPLPCRAAKGLDCVFSHLICTVRPCMIHTCHAMSMPRPCRAPTVQFWKRLLKATAQHSMGTPWHAWITIGRRETACGRPARVRFLPATTRSSKKVVIRSIPISDAGG